MKIRNVLFGAALVVATAVITTQVVSQDAKKGAPPEFTPEQLADMQKCKEAGTPGANHELLAKKVGKWNGAMKYWMEPNGQPNDNIFTADIKSLWEDRYFTEEIEGPGFEPGTTFLGKSIAGYDNVTKKFFWVWIENMGTSIWKAEGNYDPATKTFKYTYNYPDARTGKVVTGRSEEKWVNDNQIISTMYGPDKTGKEFKMMEMTLNRAK
ncbi:MAG: DUF1579 domain-containing protein [Phycisphaerales bacterium]|nr:DUF1579 domain-containing protein [Phycisphaerales bacterium]MCI0629608.1 DUF1579 domain-containing protein [Phycisphaerales bacterium]MCI0676912.1 DUF1579 domain-containing protein [Phycisphaerales bacterium]